MASRVVSFKVDERTKRQMDLHEEINWSAVARKSIEKKLMEMEAIHFDRERAIAASRRADEFRKQHPLRKGEKTSTELIREWRDKRRW